MDGRQREFDKGREERAQPDTSGEWVGQLERPPVGRGRSQAVTWNNLTFASMEGLRSALKFALYAAGTRANAWQIGGLRRMSDEGL
jgi:hypothetical protein